jgi:hypothetical protein
MEIRETVAGIVIRIKAMPNAGKNSIKGVHNGMMKVALSAPPEKGKANAELESFLAGELGIGKSRVKVIKGMTSREKSVQIDGVAGGKILKLLEESDGRPKGKDQSGG